MRKIWFIGLLLVAAGASAQQQMPQQMEDWCFGKLPEYPDHYCECRKTSQNFQLPLEIEVNDMMWFAATVDDMRNGLAAYWFSDDTLQLDVYAFCSSKTPTISLRVYPNQMYEMSNEEINAKLTEMGKMAELMSQVLTPRIQVQTVHGRSGSAYCYAYNQGPQSTCSQSLPVIPRMTYVCDRAEEVYELQPAKISSKGLGFIRWKQKKNLDGTVWLTEGSCDGKEIARATLNDSLRVLVPNAEAMNAAKNAQKSVFVHVTHDPSYVGRMIYHNSIKWKEQTIDTTLCQGMTLQLADTVLSKPTTYTNDTLWGKGDTLVLTTYHLMIDAPEATYDTLLLKADQLPYNYRNQMIPKNGWGDYDFTLRNGGNCDERVLVHVVHDSVRTFVSIRDTVCMGKTKKYGDVTCSTDTALLDSMWIDADTWAVRDIAIHFTEPEPEYDTIEVAPSEMDIYGYWYDELKVAVFYGDTLIVKKKNNTCTRWIYLTVLEGEEQEGTKIENVPFGASAIKYMRDGILYIRREGKDYDLLGRPLNINKQY